MAVVVSNDTAAVLTLTTDNSLVHGSWIDGLSPPKVIAPRSVATFESEGSGLLGEPLTGVEGTVQYAIAEGGITQGTLHIQFDSPLVESEYANTFHVFAPEGWEVSASGGQGHNAILNIRLRTTARRNVPRFHARGRSLCFANSWSPELPVMSVGYLWNRLWESLPGPLSDLNIQRVIDENWLPFTHADAGLCGGMVYLVMDYYYAHLLPPKYVNPPSSSDDPLFLYIRDRLWDSFDVFGQGHRFLAYSAPYYPDGDEGVLQVAGLAMGRAWITYREEWARIQEDIDQGRLSPLGLIKTKGLEIGDNHQVVAYAYEKTGQRVTLFIYDPNEPLKEVRLCFDVTSTSGEVHIDRYVEGFPGAVGKPIYCIFRINGYAPQAPPNGRRAASTREGITAATGLDPPMSLRGAMDGITNSLREWLNGL